MAIYEARERTVRTGERLDKQQVGELVPREGGYTGFLRLNEDLKVYYRILGNAVSVLNFSMRNLPWEDKYVISGLLKGGMKIVVDGQGEPDVKPLYGHKYEASSEPMFQMTVYPREGDIVSESVYLIDPDVLPPVLRPVPKPIARPAILRPERSDGTVTPMCTLWVTATGDKDAAGRPLVRLRTPSEQLQIGGDYGLVTHGMVLTFSVTGLNTVKVGEIDSYQGSEWPTLARLYGRLRPSEQHLYKSGERRGYDALEFYASWGPALGLITLTNDLQAWEEGHFVVVPRRRFKHGDIVPWPYNFFAPLP